jgi:hypothetical protein
MISKSNTYFYVNRVFYSKNKYNTLKLEDYEHWCVDIDVFVYDNDDIGVFIDGVQGCLLKSQMYIKRSTNIDVYDSIVTILDTISKDNNYFDWHDNIGSSKDHYKDYITTWNEEIDMTCWSSTELSATGGKTVPFIRENIHYLSRESFQNEEFRRNEIRKNSKGDEYIFFYKYLYGEIDDHGTFIYDGKLIGIDESNHAYRKTRTNYSLSMKLRKKLDKIISL